LARSGRDPKTLDIKRAVCHARTARGGTGGRHQACEQLRVWVTAPGAL